MEKAMEKAKDRVSPKDVLEALCQQNAADAVTVTVRRSLLDRTVVSRQLTTGGKYLRALAAIVE